MHIPQDLLYTREHEWVRIEADTGTIGITDHAQHALGDITFVEPPALHKAVRQAGPCSSVESVKAASDVYAPMSGEIVAVNGALADHPELVNESPYEKGWIAKMKLSDPAESKKLMTAEQYSKWIVASG